MDDQPDIPVIRIIDDEETEAMRRLYVWTKAADKLALWVWLAGGGSCTEETIGRICICSAIGKKNPRAARHATSCDELNSAYQEYKRVRPGGFDPTAWKDPGAR